MRVRLPIADLWRFGVLFVAPALALAAIAEEVGEHEPLHFDRLLVPGIGPTHFQPLTVFFGLFAAIGGGIGLSALASIPLGYLASRKRYGAALFIPAAMGGAWIINRILKGAIDRPRPATRTNPLPANWKLILAGVIVAAVLAAWQTRWRRVALYATGSLAAMGVVDLIVSKAIPLPSGLDSFPSGHAVGSMTFACALVALTWRTRWRWYVLAGGTMFAVVVGVSRIYFGLHYASDIFAGWLLAVAWTALLARLFRPILRREAAATPGA